MLNENGNKLPLIGCCLCEFVKGMIIYSLAEQNVLKHDQCVIYIYIYSTLILFLFFEFRTANLEMHLTLKL